MLRDRAAASYRRILRQNGPLDDDTSSAGSKFRAEGLPAAQRYSGFNARKIGLPCR